MVGKIFINYRRDDARVYAARIRDHLANAFGSTQVFMDVDDLRLGQRFDEALVAALNQTDVFLAVIGPQWQQTLYDRAQTGGPDFVRAEIAAALARGVVVIPVMLEHTPLPDANWLPPDLRSLVMHQKHDVTHERFGRDMTELIDAIRLHFPGFAHRSDRTATNRQPRPAQPVWLAYPLKRLIAVLFGPGRFRWARAMVGLIIVWLVSASLINAVWAWNEEREQLANNEVTVYKAFCQPYDYAFWECTMRGGQLVPTDVDKFRVDPVKQTAVRLGDHIGSVYAFKTCTIVDRFNWKCAYNDNSAVLEMHNGQFRTFMADEGDRKLSEKTGQVSRAEWKRLHAYWRHEAWKKDSWPLWTLKRFVALFF